MSANISFIVSAIDNFSATFDKLDGQIQEAYTAAGAMGAGMMVAGAAVGAGLGFAVKTAADFEKQMSKVQALTGASESEFQKLRDTAMDLGASTSKSASEVAVAMSDMAAKGFEVNEVMAAMPGIIAASEASGEDMALTANVVASALNGFGLEAGQAGKVADVLAMAANQSAASIDDMGYAFKYAAAPAKMLGISMEEIAVATGLMTDAGLEGQQAGTTLRMALIRLASPPKEAAEALKELGVEVFKADGTMKDIVDVIGEFQGGMKGMAQDQKVAALSTIFGAEAVSGMMTVLGTAPDEFAKLQKGLENSGGSAKETAKIMKDNLAGAIEQMKGATETAQISIGTALIPAVQALAGWITNLTNKFNTLPAGMQSAIAIGAAVSAGLLLMGGLVMIIISLIPGFVGGFGAIAVAMGTTAGALAVTIGWIFLIIVAIAAIGYALYKAYQNVGWFRDGVNAAWAQIRQWWMAAITWIAGITQSIMKSIGGFIGHMLQNIRTWWQQNGAAIAALAKFYFTAIWNVIRVVMSVIVAVVRNQFNIIAGIVRVVWGIIQMVISTGIHLILGWISFFAKVFTGDFKGALQVVAQTAKSIWNSIVHIFRSINLVDVGRDIVRGFVRGITGMIGTVKSAVRNIANAVPSGVKKILGIHSPSRVLESLGQFTGEGFGDGMMNMIRFVGKSANKMAAAAVPDVKAIAQPSFTAIRKSNSVTAADIEADGANRKQSGRMPQIHIERMIIREEADIRKVAAELYKIQRRGARARGAE